MKDILNKGLSKIQKAKGEAVDKVTEKWALVTEVINDLPVFVSLERSKSEALIAYDEKHYFVVPYRLSEVGISLHSMRSLPEGVPEINALPKRRIFHFPNEHAEYQVREILLEQGRDIVRASSGDKKHTIEQLANDIDKLDKKLTYGMLLVGGAAALVNPVLGVGIAVKAVLPGAASLINKYGLRPVGEKLRKSNLEKELSEAEKKILSEFEHATTVQVINPVLQELDLALNTDEATHDPLLDFDMSSMDIPELDGVRWRDLTERAIYHIYKDCLKDKSKHVSANLGPEDLRWLSSILANHLDK